MGDHADLAGRRAEAPQLADAGWPWEPLAVGGLEHGAGARAVASWPRARKLSKDAEITYLNGTVAGRLLPALRGHTTVLHVHDIVERVPRHWHGADLVLADSKAVGGRLDPLDVHVIGCPVELDPAPTPAPWPARDGGTGPVVGFVGRLIPRKGALDLVKAAPAIRAARPDVRVVIVGDDPYEDEEAEYAAAVRASANIDHVGRVAEAAGILGHLDVLVLPSRQEPFGTVVAEAMAAGTPVVATRVDGLPELVDRRRHRRAGRAGRHGRAGGRGAARAGAARGDGRRGARARRALRRRPLRRPRRGLVVGVAPGHARRRSAGGGCTTGRRRRALGRRCASCRPRCWLAWRTRGAQRVARRRAAWSVGTEGRTVRASAIRVAGAEVSLTTRGHPGIVARDRRSRVARASIMRGPERPGPGPVV